MISFDDSIRWFHSIGEGSAIAITINFNYPSDSSPTIFYNRHNAIDPFDIDTDDGDDDDTNATVTTDGRDDTAVLFSKW